VENQYEFTLTNRAKVWVLALGGILLLIAELAAFGYFRRILALSPQIQNIGFIGGFAGSMYGLYRLIRKLSREVAVVTIAPAKLTVMYPVSGTVKALAFAEILAYRYSSYNNEEMLRLKLRDGTLVRLVVFYGGQNFEGMAQQFEEVFKKYQRANGIAAVLREKTFFEKPVSTVMLLLFGALIALVAWQATASHKPLDGAFLTGLGSFIGYLAAWFAARERRNA
jgi:hypothetical protein